MKNANSNTIKTDLYPVVLPTTEGAPSPSIYEDLADVENTLFQDGDLLSIYELLLCYYALLLRVAGAREGKLSLEETLPELDRHFAGQEGQYCYTESEREKIRTLLQILRPMFRLINLMNAEVDMPTSSI